jgi:hypothetical protein
VAVTVLYVTIAAPLLEEYSRLPAAPAEMENRETR